MTGNITDNGRLFIANPYSQTYSGTIAGTGTLTKSGAGTLILTGSNSYGSTSGFNTTIKAGTVLIGVSNVGTTSRGASEPARSP